VSLPALLVFVLAVILASLAGGAVRARVGADLHLRGLVLVVTAVLFTAALVHGLDSPVTLVLVVIVAFLNSVAGVFHGSGRRWRR
jgi:hypothetical protein